MKIAFDLQRRDLKRCNGLGQAEQSASEGTSISIIIQFSSDDHLAGTSGMNNGAHLADVTMELRGRTCDSSSTQGAWTLYSRGLKSLCCSNRTLQCETLFRVLGPESIVCPLVRKRGKRTWRSLILHWILRCRRSSGGERKGWRWSKAQNGFTFQRSSWFFSAFHAPFSILCSQRCEKWDGTHTVPGKWWAETVVNPRLWARR